MAQWVAVHGYGAEQLEPDVLNRPVRELTERTNWLYEQLQGLLGAGTFEAVRILNAELDVDSDLAPSVGDFVQLDRVNRKYAQARATVSADDAYTAADEAYAVGLLTQVNADNTGTIVLYGKTNLTTSGAGWDLNGMLESGDEVYRNGPYYLSTSEAGKMTATPSGIAIYLGQFQEAATTPGYGGIALINPQYRNMGEAHIHRAYPLYDQPVGAHVLSDDPPIPTTTHSITGFITDSAPTGNQLTPRLVTVGTWTGDAATTYEIWLSNSPLDTETRIGSVAPSSDWSTVYLHWTSSDPNEAAGVLQVWSFETLYAVGSKGLVVSLEAMAGQDNDVAYDPDGADTEDLRTWTIVAPDMTRGWLPRRVRAYTANNQATDVNLSFLVYGEFTNPDNRAYEVITLKCGDIHALTYTANPTPGTTLVIQGNTFEFYTGTYAGSNIAVAIDATDMDATYQNLLDAILATNIPLVDAALSTANDTIVILTPLGATLSGTVDNITTPGSATYTGEGDIVSTNVGLLIYDEYHHCLVDSAAPYWYDIDYWAEVTLATGLKIMCVPNSADGTAVTGNGDVVTGDYWDLTIVDEAPNAKFEYAMGMHPGLSQYFPPVPRNAATLVLNGVELAAYDLFPESPDYRTGASTIHWFPDEFASVPWPRDWVDQSDPGTDVYQQNIVYHLVRMAVGTTGLVTSLRPSNGSPIRVLQCGTNDPATTGDLELDLDLNLRADDVGLPGFRVVKEVVGQKLLRGPVVEQILSDGSIEITQNAGAPNGQGVVTLSVASNQYSGDFETVALENAKQEVIGMFPYIRLLGWNTGSSSNIPTSFIAKFRVPHSIAYDQRFRVVIYATVFGESDIPWVGGGNPLYAGLTFEYNVLPDHVAIISPTGSDDVWNSLDQPLPDGLMTMTEPITVEIPFGKYNESDPSTPIYKGYDPLLIHNDNTLVDIARRQAQVLGEPFPIKEQISGWTDPLGPYVRAGSLVGIRISRADVGSVSQEYTGAIGFINLRWKLVSVGA